MFSSRQNLFQQHRNYVKNINLSNPEPCCPVSSPPPSFLPLLDWFLISLGVLCEYGACSPPLQYRHCESLLHESSLEQFMLSCEKWSGECCGRLMVPKQYRWLCKNRYLCMLFFFFSFYLHAFIYLFSFRQFCEGKALTETLLKRFSFLMCLKIKKKCKTILYMKNFTCSGSIFVINFYLKSPPGGHVGFYNHS